LSLTTRARWQRRRPQPLAASTPFRFARAKPQPPFAPRPRSPLRGSVSPHLGSFKEERVPRLSPLP
jgi:hypothetical protein